MSRVVSLNRGRGGINCSDRNSEAAEWKVGKIGRTPLAPRLDDAFYRTSW